MDTVSLVFKTRKDREKSRAEIGRMTCVLLIEQVGRAQLRLRLKPEHGEFAGWWLQNRTERNIISMHYQHEA